MLVNHRPKRLLVALAVLAFLALPLRAAEPLDRLFEDPMATLGNKFTLSGRCAEIISAGLRSQCVIESAAGLYVLESTQSSLRRGQEVRGIAVHIGFLKVLFRGSQAEMPHLFKEEDAPGKEKGQRP